MIIVVVAAVVVITSVVQQFIVVSYRSHNTLQLSSIVQQIIVSYKTTTVFIVQFVFFECDSFYVDSQKSFFLSIYLKLFFEMKSFTDRFIDSIEIIMFNDVTIHQSIDIKIFANMIEKFFIL